MRIAPCSQYLLCGYSVLWNVSVETSAERTGGSTVRRSRGAEEQRGSWEPTLNGFLCCVSPPSVRQKDRVALSLHDTLVWRIHFSLPIKMNPGHLHILYSPGPLKTRRPAPPSVHQEELQQRGQVCRQQSRYGVPNMPLEYINFKFSNYNQVMIKYVHILFLWCKRCSYITCLWCY